MKKINRFLLAIVFLGTLTIISCEPIDSVEEVKKNVTLEEVTADDPEDDEKPTLPPVGGG